MFAARVSVRATGVILGLLISTIYPAIAQTVFERTYGGAADDYGLSVQQTSDGEYIITGGTYSFGAGSYDVYLIKTNPLGDTLWTRTYGGASSDWGRSVLQTSDGGYIVAGMTSSFGVGNWDVYLIKTNPLGDTLWTRTYGGASDDHGYSVRQTFDGGYIVAGMTSSFGVGNWDVYLIKTNPLGDTLWTRTYGGASWDVGYSVQETSDGGYIITGMTSSFGAGSYDVYLIKTNPLGDTLWTRTYGGASDDHGYSVRQTFDGGYIITGSTNSFGAGNSDVYLIKTSLLGDTLWTRTYGGASWDVGYSVQETSDSGYIIAGLTPSVVGGGSDVYLIKTDPNGIVTSVYDNALSGIPSEFALQQNYPNPFNPTTTINYELPVTNWVSLKVYNLFGQEVATLTEGKQNAGYQTARWNASDVSSGVYFYRLRARDPSSSSGQVFVETKKLLLIK